MKARTDSKNLGKNQNLWNSLEKERIKVKGAKYNQDHKEQQKQNREKNKEKLKQYNTLYKEKNRKKLNAKQAIYQKEKRRLTKLFRPLYNLESQKGETFTQFYNRKVQELKHQDKPKITQTICHTCIKMRQCHMLDDLEYYCVECIVNRSNQTMRGR